MFFFSFLFFSFLFFCFFFSPRALRPPSADRRETLPCDRNFVQFYNPCLKIWGALFQKKLGPKTCKIWGDFGQLQTLIANISGTDNRGIQNRKTNVSTAILPAFGEKSRVNFGPLTTKLDMWVWTHRNKLFRKTVFRPIRGAAGSNLHTS